MQERVNERNKLIFDFTASNQLKKIGGKIVILENKGQSCSGGAGNVASNQLIEEKVDVNVKLTNQIFSERNFKKISVE